MTGPGSERPRRDPRSERAARLVPGTARMRIDRSGRPVTAVAAREAAVARPVAAGDPSQRVLVVAEAADGRLTRHDRQLLGVARGLAAPPDGAVVLALSGVATQTMLETAAAAGADRVMTLAAEEDPARRATWLAAEIRHLQPLHVLFGETVVGGDLARRVAVLLDETLLGELEALSPRDTARAARAGRVERHRPPARLLALQPDRAASYRGPVRAVALLTEAERAPAVERLPASGMAAREVAGDPAGQALAEAPFVMAAGNGVVDLVAFRRLAAALGATPGASRVMCDAGLMPRAAQVGASGTVLSGECYLALGISGAPQHLQGIGQVPHVVAVNTDLHAAMVARAELAVIADAQAVMTAMLAQLESGA